jgi:hypothetical protein
MANMPTTSAGHPTRIASRVLRDELKLELSAERALVIHARTRAAVYFGYEIIVQHGDSKISALSSIQRGKAGPNRTCP